MRFDAIVLCGGAARRLDGTDKGALIIGGRSLLDRALEAVADACNTVVVGPQRRVVRDVRWTLEEPPGGGPVAAIDAGLELTEEACVVVLGVDFPFVDADCVARILAALDEQDGVILIDETGRHQFLVGAYRRDALVAALEGRDPRGMSVKDLIADLDLLLLDDPRSTRDCDTWDDVRAAEEMLAEGAL